MINKVVARRIDDLCILCGALQGTMVSEKAKFSFEARRFPKKISIEIRDENVAWRYVYLGNTWNHTAPLSTLEPYPTFTESQFGMRIGTTAFPIAVFGIIVLMVNVGLTEVTFGVSLLVLMSFVLWVALCRIIGPIHWAIFASEYENKDVFFFQDRDIEAFKAFAEQMTTLILNARLAKMSETIAE